MSEFVRIIPIISESFIFRGKLTPDTRFIEDLGADSLDIVEFMLRLEEEFDFEINEQDLVNIQTVGDVVTYIKEKINFITNNSY